MVEAGRAEVDETAGIEVRLLVGEAVWLMVEGFGDAAEPVVVTGAARVGGNMLQPAKRAAANQTETDLRQCFISPC